MTNDIDQIKQQSDIVEIIGRSIELKKEGVNYKGICPFHADEKASLTVSSTKQYFKCFACGAAGDSFDFLTKQGMTIPEAKKYIVDAAGIVLDQPQRKRKEPKEKPFEMADATNAGVPTFNHYKFGVPSQTWPYKDEAGTIISYACRFDLEDGKKNVLPYTYMTNGEVTDWRWGGMSVPRFLYNADLIIANPDALIIVVEGEKCADAAQAQFDPSRAVATTWPGGADGVKSANWSIIHGRRIILWPDNDFDQKYGDKHELAGLRKPWQEQPGNHAMITVFNSLNEYSESIKWLIVPESFPNKWDAADKFWASEEMRKFINKHNADAVDVISIKSQDPPQKPAPPVPPAEEVEEDHEMQNEYYRILGYDKDETGKLVYFFFSFNAKCVIKLSPTAMSKSNLLMLAPLNHWELHFPAKNGISIDGAQQYLIETSHSLGIFREKQIRGRGAWVDEGNIVIHTGSNLIIGKKRLHLQAFKSKFVYEIGESLGFGAGDPLASSESAKLLKFMEWFKWQRDISAYLLSGWCVIAPFCGVLDWRPHIWITGPAGSGKSTVMDNVVKRLMGETAIVVQGKTTEAGIRGMLQSDARPVLFDESDIDNKNDEERVQSVLALARSSSYKDGGQIGKGTSTGLSRSYTVRSCFAFSSIGVQLNQQSDRSRFTMLEMMSFEGLRSDSEYVEFMTDWHETVNTEYVNSLHKRTIGLLPVIIKNSKTFAEAASQVIGNRRIGDQVGSMLAGAYSLTSKSEISLADAVEWVKQKDWSDEKALELSKDEFRLFNTIIQCTVKVEGVERTAVELSIGEVILIASGRQENFMVTDNECDKKLRRLGIMVNMENQEVMFANSSNAIKKLIIGTPWSKNHGRVLERLPEAKKISPRVFAPGISSRSVSIPLDMVGEKPELKY